MGKRGSFEVGKIDERTKIEQTHMRNLEAKSLQIGLSLGPQGLGMGLAPC